MPTPATEENGPLSKSSASPGSEPKSEAEVISEETRGIESGADEDALVASDLTELEQELEKIRREADDAADRALRTLAEFDNYRKRSERERREAGEVGAAAVLRELLDVVDNFDRALEHAGEGVPASFLEGLRLVARGVHDILDRRGVKKIETVGIAFDPHVHEALASEPTPDAPANTIVQEIQSGFTLGDRVLRPARVIVARAPAE